MSINITPTKNTHTTFFVGNISIYKKGLLQKYFLMYAQVPGLKTKLGLNEKLTSYYRGILERGNFFEKYHTYEKYAYYYFCRKYFDLEKRSLAKIPFDAHTSVQNLRKI